MNWLVKDKPQSVESRYVEALDALRRELIVVHNEFELVIFPGDTAIRMLGELVQGNLPRELLEKVKLVSHQDSKRMFKERGGDCTTLKAVVGSAGSVLVVDDFSCYLGKAAAITFGLRDLGKKSGYLILAVGPNIGEIKKMENNWIRGVTIDRDLKNLLLTRKTP